MPAKPDASKGKRQPKQTPAKPSTAPVSLTLLGQTLLGQTPLSQTPLSHAPTLSATANGGGAVGAGGTSNRRHTDAPGNGDARLAPREAASVEDLKFEELLETTMGASAPVAPGLWHPEFGMRAFEFWHDTTISAHTFVVAHASEGGLA